MNAAQELNRLYFLHGTSAMATASFKIQNGCSGIDCKDIRTLAKNDSDIREIAILKGISLKWDSEELQFDHISQETKYRNKDGKTVHPSNMIKRGNANGGSRYAWETIRAEILKCRILCGNCHAAHSKNQRNGE